MKSVTTWSRSIISEGSNTECVTELKQPPAPSDLRSGKNLGSNCFRLRETCASPSLRTYSPTEDAPILASGKTHGLSDGLVR